MFKIDIHEKYFPRRVRQQKIREFIKVEQGDSTMAGYEANFAKLSKFAPNLVADEESRARKFEDGLKPEIKKAVVPFELTTYREVLNKAS